MARPKGEKTLIEIIEDTKSGVPAKSELETKVSKSSPLSGTQPNNYLLYRRKNSF